MSHGLPTRSSRLLTLSLLTGTLLATSSCAADIPQPASPSPSSAAPSAPASSPAPSSAPPSSAPPSPSPSVSSAPGLTAANLLTTSDVPTPESSIEVEEVVAGKGRKPAAVSICSKPGDLGATATLTRNFRFILAGLGEEEGGSEDAGPDPKDPSVYTVVMQFSDAAAARTALKTYQGWAEDCRQTLATSKDWRPIKASANSGTWHKVKLSGPGEGAWAQVPLYRSKQDKSDNGLFETVGLTLVDNRLMVTVDLVYGMDKISSDKQGGDPDNGMPADRQFGLIEAAAERLG